MRRPALLLVIFLVAGAVMSSVAAERPSPADSSTRPAQVPTPTTFEAALPSLPIAHGGDTRCILCHTTDSWRNVTFAHEKTGFPLNGLHRQAACQACHPQGFAQPIGNTCQSCHRDVHGGNFGNQCAGCHDETQWKPTFSVDAHRRTNFPLAGAHATLPCLECHQDSRDRTFSPAATAPCLQCHLADYQRTESGSVGHVGLAFGTNCRDCHEAGSFARGTFPGHDKCFGISAGDHAGIRCESCHTSLRGTMATGLCETRTASCTGCHEHTCAHTDAQHAENGGVQGYQCKDRKCYECHQFTPK